jgi:D-alanyl-lipoteichoic acid acyltransferase DltB (MBOAT superfamily)
VNFNSVIFLIYLPLVILIYWILPHKARWAFLLLASYFFYAYHNVFLIFLILGTTLVSFFAALGIQNSQKKGLKVFLLVLSLVLILGALFVFKYLDFAVTSVVSLVNLFGCNASYSVLNLILPVGISFYTFQTLSYVIDVYRGKFEAERHIGYYALFVSFFPQLVAGPIERPNNLIPQLKAIKKIDFPSE